MSKRKDAPFGRLRYLYMGTSNVQKDVDYYTKVLGGQEDLGYLEFRDSSRRNAAR